MKNRSSVLRWGMLALLAPITPLSWSQEYKIDDSTIDSGGGTSEGGRFKVESTIGQPDTGTSTGGGYTFEGGFWHGGVEAVQVAGLPQLRITRGEQEIEIHWKDPDDAYVLTESTTLRTDSWSPTERQVLFKSGEKTVFLAELDDAARFFQLKRK